MSVLTLVPAYGRDYANAQSALADWRAGKDFQMAPCGRYCSVRDEAALQAEGVRWLNIRYKCLSRVAVLKIGD